MICCQDGCFMVRQRRIAEEYLWHNLFDDHCLEDTGVTWCFPTRVGGHYSPDAAFLGFLIFLSNPHN